MGGPLYKDDPAITDDADLWRRIHPTWAVPDENRDCWRVSSAAFDDSPDGSPLSVLLASVVASTGRTAEEVMKRFDGYALASITAGVARARGQAVASTPEPDELAHASVVGPKTKPNRRELAKAARWVLAPRQGLGE
jgi:hypothetical protein